MSGLAEYIFRKRKDCRASILAKETVTDEKALQAPFGGIFCLLAGSDWGCVGVLVGARGVRSEGLVGHKLALQL